MYINLEKYYIFLTRVQNYYFFIASFVLRENFLAKGERKRRSRSLFSHWNDPYFLLFNYYCESIALTLVLHAEQSRVVTFPHGTYKISHGSLLHNTSDLSFSLDLPSCSSASAILISSTMHDGDFYYSIMFDLSNIFLTMLLHIAR